MAEKEIIYDAEKGLKLADIHSVLFDGGVLQLSSSVQQVVADSFSFLQRFSEDKVIYGINTGFGPMAQYRVQNGDLKQLQYNLIRSHATGAGAPLPPRYVKAAMVARLVTFLQGYSGVHPDLVNLLLTFINQEIIPFIPEHGSVGASGDLVQLAHMALALIGEGEVYHDGRLQPAGELLSRLGLTPLTMVIREGLSVTNGTSVMTGIGLVNLIYAKQLLSWSVIASVMMNEIASSYDDFMSEVLNGAKRHRGQQLIAATMRHWSEGSRAVRNRAETLYRKSSEQLFDHKIQPYYSLRCVPQILGPVYDAIHHAEELLLRELHSACDNPIVDAASENVYHGGNFHGDYVAYEMDALKIAITKQVMLAERQLNYLFHDRINGILPPFVNMGTLGVNYGLQAAQFTATSTTAECQTLSNPMSIHSIPNNNDNQDVVSMGTNAALMTKMVIENGYQVMAIHFMALVQAVDCLDLADRLSPKTAEIYHEIRAFFPLFKEDTPKYKEIETMQRYLKNRMMSVFE